MWHTQVSDYSISLSGLVKCGSHNQYCLIHTSKPTYLTDKFSVIYPLTLRWLVVRWLFRVSHKFRLISLIGSICIRLNKTQLCFILYSTPPPSIPQKSKNSILRKYGPINSLSTPWTFWDPIPVTFGYNVPSGLLFITNWYVWGFSVAFLGQQTLVELHAK